MLQTPLPVRFRALLAAIIGPLLGQIGTDNRFIPIPYKDEPYKMVVMWPSWR